MADQDAVAGKNVPAQFEFDNRPIDHRSFGPNQDDAFLSVREMRFSLHRDCDIGLFAKLLAVQFDPPILLKSHLDTLKSNFSRAGLPMLKRFQVHLGAGLRTPDGQAFCAIAVPVENTGGKVREFAAIGASRADEAVGQYTELVLWDHEDWQKRYKELYQPWLDHLLWATDGNGVPQPPPARILPRNPKSTAVLTAGSVEDVPEDWLMRLHRDSKASSKEYKLNGGKCSSLRCLLSKGAANVSSSE